MVETPPKYSVPSGNNKRKKKGRSVIDVIEGARPVTDEVKRFEMILYSKDVLTMVTGDPWALAEARKLMTGNNLLVLNAAAETNTAKRYRMIAEKLCELNSSQFAPIANLFPVLEYTMLVRDRCELCRDEAACAMFDKIVNGDPDSKIEEEKLGLIGLWTLQDNRNAGSVLVAVGKLTLEEYKKEVDRRDAETAKTKETLHGCAFCGAIFPESKCVRVAVNSSVEWVCITDYKELVALGKIQPIPEIEEKTRAELGLGQAMHDNFLKSISALIQSVSALVRNNGDSDAHQLADRIRGQITDAVETKIITEAEAVTLREQVNKALEKPEEKEIPPPPKEKEQEKEQEKEKKKLEKLARLDLMKNEINEKIAKMKGKKEGGVNEGVAEKIEDLSKEEHIKLAKGIAATIPPREEKKEEQEEEIYRKVVEIEQKKAPPEYIYLDDIDKLPKEKRIQIARKIASGEIKIIREGKEHEEWTLYDFMYIVGLINTVEDLRDLARHINDSKSTTLQEKEKLMEIVAQREAEIQSGSPDIKKAQEREREKLRRTEVEYYLLREDLGSDAVRETPEDYSAWMYSDFEFWINNAESVEDLEEMSDYMELADQLIEDEKKELRALAEKRMKELKEGGW